MSRSRLYSLLCHLHRAHHADANHLLDAQLLERFARLRDEAAFQLLVWRHERMVLGVCRSLLHDEHDAEDSFQATFLTLARKAASIGRREAVAYTRLEADENKRTQVVLWDVQSGRERAVLRTSAGLRTPQFSLAVPFSPDGAALLTTDPSHRNLRLWDVATASVCSICLRRLVSYISPTTVSGWRACLEIKQATSAYPIAATIRCHRR